MSHTTDEDIQPDKEDIIFECPQCRKSLEIDAKGAGYLIVCPDCKNEIQVPSWEDLEEVEPAASAPAARVEHPISDDAQDSLEQLKVKIADLELRQRTDNVCFKRLGDEITLVQAALDRITEIVESRHSEV